MPSGKMVKIGAWELGKYIGAVVFSRGTNQHIAKPFGLSQQSVVELTRVALSGHVTQVSRIVAIAIKTLCRNNPGLKLIVSFADTRMGHAGTIYQAGGWVYTGTGTDDKRCQAYRKDGIVYQWRSVCADLGKKSIKRTISGAVSDGYEPLGFYPKHRYLMPLDAEMRARVLPLSKPYPKRPKKPDEPDQGNRGRGSTDPDAPSSAVTE
jgi:hypothetical protein